jgi:hypothetical protein
VDYGTADTLLGHSPELEHVTEPRWSMLPGESCINSDSDMSESDSESSIYSFESDSDEDPSYEPPRKPHSGSARSMELRPRLESGNDPEFLVSPRPESPDRPKMPGGEELAHCQTNKGSVASHEADSEVRTLSQELQILDMQAERPLTTAEQKIGTIKNGYV